jgi:hypothetical protein
VNVLGHVLEVEALQLFCADGFALIVAECFPLVGHCCPFFGFQLHGCRSLNLDPLDLIERDFITAAIVKLGGARTFGRGHGLGVFDRAGLDEIRRDAGRGC